MGLIEGEYSFKENPSEAKELLETLVSLHDQWAIEKMFEGLVEEIYGFKKI